ncbi:MAG: caspase family protein [Pseudomonadota bacterium]
MKNFVTKIYSVVLLSFIILNGCAQTVQKVPKPNIQSPLEGKVRIVITRQADDDFCGDWIRVLENGKVIGDLGCGGSIIWDRPVGETTLTAQHYSAGMLTFRYSPYVLNATKSEIYKLYISALHRETIKTFRTEVSVPPSEKSSPQEIMVKKMPVSADVSSSSHIEIPRQIEKWALIIGISDYKDTNIPGLRYSADDATAFYNWTISPNGGKYAPSRVKLLLNQDATGKNIRNALFVWLRQALEEDMVTIYFAGHGSPESPDSSSNLFLLPYDAQYNDVATTGFPMWDIETALKRFIKAKKVVVVADACHSGGIGHPFEVARRSNRAIKINPISSGLQNLSKIGDGVCVISASDEKQLSQESQNWGGGHGVFTYFLIEALKGKADYNDDGLVTLGELIPYLSEQVRRATKNAQAPTVAGKFDPALTIGR